MSNNLVYLFELDSVRKSPAECKIAQEKLFREILKGNRPILSYNQVSSLAMMDLFDVSQNEQTRKPLFALCASKRILVSEYRGNAKEATSLVDYLIKSAKPGGEFFIFSNLYFLNDLPPDHQVFEYIANILLHPVNPMSAKEIETNFGFGKDRSKALYEYLKVMRELVSIIPQQPPFEGEMYKLDHYIGIVRDAVDKNHCGIDDEIIGKGIELIEEALNANVCKSRSECQRYLIGRLDSVGQEAVFFARSVLDLSYNYQIERSIRGITITHDIEDAAKIAEAVCSYYHTHSFSAADRMTQLPKHMTVLNWNALARFFRKASDEDYENEKSLNKHIKKVCTLRSLWSLGVAGGLTAIVLLLNYLMSLSMGFFAIALLTLASEILDDLFGLNKIGIARILLSGPYDAITYHAFKKRNKCKRVFGGKESFVFAFEKIKNLFKKRTD